MELHLTTLTPIHIGTGKTLTELDFFENKRINFGKFIEGLSKHDNEKFEKLMELENIEKMSLESLFRTLKTNAKTSLHDSVEYEMEGSFQKDAREGIKDNSKRFYIPGSSIKGVVRTALLCSSLGCDENLKDYLLSMLKKIELSKKEGKRRDQILKGLDAEIQSLVFNCGVAKIDSAYKREENYYDQKYDLLKILHVSDTNHLDEDKNGKLTKLQVYALGKKDPHKPFMIMTESIPESAQFRFDMKIDIQFLRKCRELIRNRDGDFGKREWISIIPKVKSLYGIDLESESEIQEENIVTHILECLYEFGQMVSEIEDNWFETNEKQRLMVKGTYDEKQKVKIGFASGFSATTILTLLLTTKDLKSNTKKIYETLGIGKHGNGNSLNIDVFPFTRKFSKENGLISSFGWCRISKDKPKMEEQASAIIHSESPPKPSWVIAEVMDAASKPVKVKILSGDFAETETIMPVGNAAGLGITSGTKLYVELQINKKKKLEKVEFKRIANVK